MDEPTKVSQVVKSRAALPVEIITAGALILGVVLIGSRVADLVLTVMACGVCYLAGRFGRR